MKNMFYVVLCAMLISVSFADDKFYKSQIFDWTKKGNVYENEFRVPFSWWRLISYTPIVFEIGFLCGERYDLYEPSSYSSQAPLQIHEYIHYLGYIWTYSYRHYYDKTIESLNAFHPNQYLAFKITLTPLGNPKDKIEKVISFPLYITRKEAESIKILGNIGQALISGRGDVRYFVITLMKNKLKTWHKYHIRIEVLNDIVLPEAISNHCDFSIYRYLDYGRIS